MSTAEITDAADTDESQPTVERARRIAATRKPSRAAGRGVTISGKLTRDEWRASELVVYDDADRPKTRGECASMPRPCPWVSCTHHLFIDVNPECGSIKLNFPHLEVWEMSETCALDVADKGGVTLEVVGELTNITRERVRQLETRSLSKLKAAVAADDRRQQESKQDHRIDFGNGADVPQNGRPPLTPGERAVCRALLAGPQTYNQLSRNIPQASLSTIVKYVRSAARKGYVMSRGERPAVHSLAGVSEGSRQP